MEGASRLHLIIYILISISMNYYYILTWEFSAEDKANLSFKDSDM